MNKLKLHIACIFAWSLLALISCDNSAKKYTDTATAGNIHIAVDDSYTSIIEGEVYAFQSFYPKAKINAHYLQEGDAMKLFLQDSARLIILNRELNADELAMFEERNLKPRITKIAYDGVAVIVHPNNKDTNLTLTQLQKIFSGENKKWSQLNSKSSLGDIKIILDNKASSNGRLMQERFLKSKNFPANCYAAHSNSEVVQYVSKHPEAIGIIGANWISDKDDTLALSFLKKVNVVALCDEKGENPSEFFKPYQAYIKLKQYPLYRTVYIISREARAGLGSGFTAFVAGDKGQRIILKSGLVPATAPIRIVEINN
ncbi:MAG: PstS family phosphate ABC transporter substrate-binding protein [Flavobacteriales bacterium]